MTFIHLRQKSDIPGTKEPLESPSGGLIPPGHRPRLLKLPDEPGDLLTGEPGHPFEIPQDHALLLPSERLIPEPYQGALDQGIALVLGDTDGPRCSLQKLFDLRQRFQLRVVHNDHHASYYERSDRFQTHTLVESRDPFQTHTILEEAKT
jgi:hypothetical protein